ncbi:hypothetical protein [Dysgonomonas sp. 25]|uniref:hypothetical protein n=1 Tax=Dysgonomonas sp. 25 TaxID=2302933 RepID=UPI0013D2BF0C|nr:hypothetical protein [Dysgonomonas sp. 25]NDV70045.1 hypothetical protein [Dysgonomonas sp. 25]
MKKIKWGDLIVALLCMLVLVHFSLDNNAYDYFVKNPFDHGSGTTSSRLWYFMMYKLDQWIGKTGVICLFVALTLFFLYHFYKENMNSIINRYRDWKKKRENHE